MFVINDIEWNIVWVNAYSSDLMRSDGSYTVGMTDWNTKCVYLAKRLKGGFLRKVMAHELVHCFCFSYSIHIPIAQEEFLADWVSRYGRDLITILDDIMFIVLKNRVA